MINYLNNNHGVLLKTITIPKNLSQLTQKLPAPNYRDSRNKS